MSDRLHPRNRANRRPTSAELRALAWMELGAAAAAPLHATPASREKLHNAVTKAS